MISAYGCWMSTKRASSEHGTTTESEEEFKDKIKLNSPYAQKEIHRKVGTWGYLMQAMYQVSPSRFHFCFFLEFCHMLDPLIHSLVCAFSIRFRCNPASSLWSFQAKFFRLPNLWNFVSLLLISGIHDIPLIDFDIIFTIAAIKFNSCNFLL